MSDSDADNLTARLYRSGASAAEPVTVSISTSGLQFRVAGQLRYHNWSAMTLNQRLGRLPFKFDLPGGDTLELPWSEQVQTLLAGRASQPGRDWLVWLENHWGICAAAVLMLPLLLWIGYIWVVPAVAANAASRIPPAWEQRLGNEVINYLDKEYTTASQLKQSEMDRVVAVWEQLDIGPDYQLQLRSSVLLGANALALPGGTIVITDSLVRLLDNNAELAAVIGHELGHIDNDHMTTNLVQTAVLALLINWVVGDIGGIAEYTLTAIPTVLGKLAYSRQFELQADAAAAEFLQQRDLQPGCLGSALLKLERFAGNRFSGLSVPTDAGDDHAPPEDSDFETDPAEQDHINSHDNNQNNDQNNSRNDSRDNNRISAYLSTHPGSNQRAERLGSSECRQHQLVAG